MRPEVLERWHAYVADPAPDKLEALLADDAVFQSPAVHTPQAGKALVAKYLGAAMVVLNNPSFTYVGEWLGERSAVLEFELTLDDLHVNGVDLIHWNDDGRITLFKVMLRPLKALNTVIPLMGKELAGG
ncbi:nuclear transport factor 2 family protein [Chelatococcus reniformis]|uniref:SnoaL-like domain-containing protein n=1 Tax=Chelatococcus reniformis TaxID=1494448 RepID=A0A916UNF6_9HYPH|nr:nuclear transport factor 2 family protein [Chelatococcus reniformis]GGC77320.1 hypothetical protein GCM10010994_39530 [Chelatococcus reniformis]